MTTDWFSAAQCLGYVAFILGDKRFKLLMTGECIAYVAHFALLGNPTATASSAVSTVRSFLAMWTRSLWVVGAVLSTNIGFGLAIATKWSDWLPLTASCLGTVAPFLLRGIPMRLVMLCGTGFWIANNLIVGSIGGTALEVVVAATNTATIVRMARARSAIRSSED